MLAISVVVCLQEMMNIIKPMNLILAIILSGLQATSLVYTHSAGDHEPYDVDQLVVKYYIVLV